MSTQLVGAWWGYAEADRTILGIVVAVVATLAVAYVVARLVRSRRAPGPRRPRGGGRS